jgi:hypothetical protein
VIIAFFLPERISCTRQHLVGPHEQVNVIWHDSERMQSVAAQHVGIVIENVQNHARDRRLLKIEWTSAGLLQ